jgi:hypothetical protein
VVRKKRGEPVEAEELGALVALGLEEPSEHPATQTAPVGQWVRKLELVLSDAVAILLLRVDRLGEHAEPAATGAGQLEPPAGFVRDGRDKPGKRLGHVRG